MCMHRTREPLQVMDTVLKTRGRAVGDPLRWVVGLAITKRIDYDSNLPLSARVSKSLRLKTGV